MTMPSLRARDNKNSNAPKFRSATTIVLPILAVVLLFYQSSRPTTFSSSQNTQLTASALKSTPATLAQCPVVSTKGAGFDIFCPHLDADVSMSPQLLSSPETWITNLEGRLTWLDTIVHNDDRPIKERSVNTYIEFLHQYVCGLSYGKEEKTVGPSLASDLVRQTTSHVTEFRTASKRE
jgi:hypothetical protein